MLSLIFIFITKKKKKDGPKYKSNLLFPNFFAYRTKKRTTINNSTYHFSYRLLEKGKIELIFFSNRRLHITK